MTASGGSETQFYAAVDIGAESGRVMVGKFGAERVELEEVYRFPNRPLKLLDGLHWDLGRLFAELLHGLEAARLRAGRLDGIGLDTWAVDYGLLDTRDRLLGLPFHYRDSRTDGMAERAFARVPAERQYAIAGIQAMPINTVFQLLAEEGSRGLAAAKWMALVPDLLSFWLCGERANERTVASTTGLLDAREGSWSAKLIEDIGLPRRIFGELVDPGTVLGPVLDHYGLGSTPVIATAAHDTAAAFAAAPISGRGAAVLSSGTWSLIGVELPAPLLSRAARDANLSNERGVEGTTRLLKNVMGLWLVQECRRDWAAQGLRFSYSELMRWAAETDDEEAALFDPDHEALLLPGGMPTRIIELCAERGQVLARDPGPVTRAILVSLACKYRFVIERLEAVCGWQIAEVHAIGGGARNRYLCQLTADLLGRPVTAGPYEASALGNVLVQAGAVGEVCSLAEMRSFAAASTKLLVHEPARRRSRAESLYQRFLSLTRLSPTPSSMSFERS